MTPIPGASIETVHPPQQYTERQLDEACQIAHLLHRGKFVLATKPAR